MPSTRWAAACSLLHETRLALTIVNCPTGTLQKLPGPRVNRLGSDQTGVLEDYDELKGRDSNRMYRGGYDESFRNGLTGARTRRDDHDRIQSVEHLRGM